MFPHKPPKEARIREAEGLVQAKLVGKWHSLNLNTCLSDFKVWVYSNTPHMCLTEDIWITAS